MNVIEEIINLKKQLQEGAGKVIGEVKEIACITVPDGWLPCDGSEYLKSDYPELYTAIGDLWGVNNPPSDALHFRVPDKRKNVGVGYDPSDSAFDAIGKTGGEKAHKLTGAEAAQKAVDIGSSGAHYHTTNARSGSSTSGGTAIIESFPGASSTRSVRIPRGDGTNGSHTHSIAAADATNAHNNLQPYAVFYYIIRAK